MVWMKNLLRNRNFIFMLALAAGLAFPLATPVTRHLVLPALALAMTLATMEIAGNRFHPLRTLLLPALLGIVMNYLILGNIIIALAAFLIQDEMFWTGFVLLAAVPPAVAVIPFSGFLNGNSSLSLFGTVGAYLGGLVIMPVIAVGLLSSAPFNPLQLLLVTLELILLPLALSRILIWRKWDRGIAPHRGTLTNWSFFVVLYTLVGLNRGIILSQASNLLAVVAIAFVTMFLVGFLIDWIAGRFQIPPETRMSLVLLGTLKNQGMAGAIALTMFNPEAALPAAVFTMVMILYILWLDFRNTMKLKGATRQRRGTTEERQTQRNRS